MRAAAIAVIVAAAATGMFAQNLRVQAAVERTRVYQGEPFVFQIQVEGSETPDQPNFPQIDGFEVQPMGGQQNSSRSISIVNGRMSQVVREGYIFNYQITATTTGTLTIPPLTVRASGKTAQTQPVPVTVLPPEENDDVRLRIGLSEQKAYIGQPVVMTFNWYIARNVRSYSFQLPVLNDSRFQIIDPKVNADPNRHVRIQLPNGQILAEKSPATYDGRQYILVRFQKVLIPRQPGTITITPATVAGEIVTEYNRRQGAFSDPFGRSVFDDDFFSSPFGSRGAWEAFSVPSNPVQLQVLELPSAGRPPNYSGLVGEFRIEGDASPADVNVGDPITLKLRVSGPGYLDNVDMPPLQAQPSLTKDFMIPAERAPGVVERGVKEFTQTIRARSSDVHEVPPVELAYFNPKEGRYEVARTQAIPVTVRGTRIITANDAEGFGEGGSVRSQVESAEGGISYNYEGPDILSSEAPGVGGRLRSPAWLGALAVPPLVYFGLLGFVMYTRWRESDPVARKAKRAYKELTRTLAGLQVEDTDAYYEKVFTALRQYLGSRLNLSPGALTFADAKAALDARALPPALAEELGALFQRCEAGRYAGAGFGAVDTSLKQSALDIAGRLERELG